MGDQKNTNTINILKKVQKIFNSAWIGKNEIINTNGPEIAIRYMGDHLFNREFGIQNLSNFIETLTLKDGQNVSFDEKHVIIEPEDKTFKINFRFTNENVYNDVIQRNKKVSILMNKCKEKIENNDFLHFNLNTDNLSIIKKVSKMFIQDDNSLIKIEQDNVDNISLHVEGEHTCAIKRELINPGKKFIQPANIKLNSILDGNWDCYLFNTSINLDTNEQQILETEEIPPTFLYLVDKEQSLETLMLFFQKKQ